ncbi:MAG: hypothetical protein ACFCD0_06670 [Gemmataceae bacterium]
MKATVLWCAAILLAGLSTCPAPAQVIWCAPALRRPLGVAPDACGPGFYVRNYLGQVYGPSYYLRPCWKPEGGLKPGQPIHPASLMRTKGPPPTYPRPMYTRGPGRYPMPPPQGYPQRPGLPYPAQVPRLPGQPTLPTMPTPAALPMYPSPPNPPNRWQPKPRQPATVIFPNHPYARGPRDFFMWSEGYEDPLNRVRLPVIMP